MHLLNMTSRWQKQGGVTFISNSTWRTTNGDTYIECRVNIPSFANFHDRIFEVSEKPVRMRISKDSMLYQKISISNFIPLSLVAQCLQVIV